MEKDANKYAFHIEYDAKEGKTTAVFTKNYRIVSFDELPDNEKNVFRCMVAEVVEAIFPGTHTEGESEQDNVLS